MNLIKIKKQYQMSQIGSRTHFLELIENMITDDSKKQNNNKFKKD